MKTAVLFSGQGAQHVGMGLSIYENVESARGYWDRADEILGFSLKEIAFNGPEERLTDTSICQPALYVHGYSIFKALEEMGRIGELRAALGLSLGELTALGVAGVFDFETGLKIVAERGRLMQEACEATDGGMASLIGGTPELVRELCKECDVDMANVNCPGQIVISGEREKIDLACNRAKEMEFSRVIALKVAGAYHSRLMRGAAESFEKFLANIEFKAPRISVFTNTTGKEVRDPKGIKEALVRQVVSSVLWDSCMKNAAELGIEEYFECGPGKVLTGLARRINKDWVVRPVSEYGDLNSAITGALKK